MATLILIDMLINFVLAFWEGFVVKTLWAWFVIPVFALPELSLIQAIGITLLIGLLTQRKTDQELEESDRNLVEKTVARLIVNAIRPTICLVFGGIFTLFL